MLNVYEKMDGFSPPEDQKYYLLASNGLFFINRAPLTGASEIIFFPVGNKGLGWLEPHEQTSSSFFRNVVSFLKIMSDKAETIKKGGIKMFEVYQKNKDFEPPDDQIYYLLAKNGVFLVKKTLFYTSSIPVFTAAEDKGLGWLAPHTAKISFHPAKMIPFAEIERITEFFHQVFLAYKGSEAVVIIYWDEKVQNYYFYVPEQQVGAGIIAKYKIGTNPKGCIKLGTIHSHGAGSAYHSKQDDGDEEHDDGIHITIGNVNFNPTFACSVVSDGMRTTIHPGDIIEINRGPVDVPDDWVKKVSEYVIPVVTHGVGYFPGKSKYVRSALKRSRR